MSVDVDVADSSRTQRKKSVKGLINILIEIVCQQVLNYPTENSEVNSFLGWMNKGRSLKFGHISVKQKEREDRNI